MKAAATILLALYGMICYGHPISEHLKTQESADHVPGTENPAKGVDSVFTFAEVMPEFPGGLEEMYKFLSSNIRYPDLAVQMEISGKVIIRFVIDEQGNIQSALVMKGIGAGCDEEARRVVMSMPPWKPGMQGGIPVKVMYTLPINFQLPGKNKEKKQD